MHIEYVGYSPEEAKKALEEARNAGNRPKVVSAALAEAREKGPTKCLLLSEDRKGSSNA